MAELTQDLVRGAAQAAMGTTVVHRPDGSTVDLAEPWHQVTLYQAVSEALDVEVTPDTPLEDLRKLAAAHDVALRDEWSAGAVVLELFEKLVEHTIVEPTFVRDFPVEVRPLTRAHRDDPRLAEAWDLIVFGTELATAYSELVDPVVQRERLRAQSLRAAAGDVEAMQLDEDFLRAIEYGMPPSGGMGMGIDRLLMTLTGLGIRETILFPLVRPE
jgi:lysyl-tRNA synthetase class 2